MPDLLTSIREGGLCHGCGACASAVSDSKLSMQMSAAGFLRPYAQVPLNKSDEKVVEAVCSGFTMERPRDSSAPYDADWGSLHILEAGHATDPEIRYRGSSGGVLSAIALFLIEAGEVDFVLQTAALKGGPVDNETRASHARVEVIEAAGSRYGPSAPLAELNSYLESGKRFAFLGKPCDVASLRRMAKIDARIDAQIPFALSFFCAGVPSRKGAIAVLESLGVKEQEVSSFEYRGRGWPGLTRATLQDGTEKTMDYNSSWGSILNRHLQFRCKICVEGIGEYADIACADAWYGKDGYPDFTERQGRSLIVARTKAGAELLGRMKRMGRITSEPIILEDLRLMQPYQYSRRRTLLARLTAMRVKGRLLPRYLGFPLLSLAARTSPWAIIRNFLGSYRRLPANRSTPVESTIRVPSNQAEKANHPGQ